MTRRRRTIEQLAGASRGIARVIGLAGELLLGGLGLGLLLGQAHADEIAISDAREAVAGGADLSEDLVAAADAAALSTSGAGRSAYPAWSNDCQNAAWLHGN